MGVLGDRKQGTALLRQVTGVGGRVGGHGLLSSGDGRKCGSGNLDRLSEGTDFSQRGLSVDGCQGMLINLGKDTVAAPSAERCTYWPRSHQLSA